ncbi:uncharacterized protein LOC106436440 isoform X1 [Brassica napus]|uniref:uncharacterized protein LOC106436440 isoform X1 n=1 Tax=Brassica napus TaxID=3708 RepID=UPI002078C271|nr:uncharacterized protein LOC106436440 isoform X1 [Brassica napus]
MATEKFGIIIEKNPPESTLIQLGVRNMAQVGTYSSKQVSMDFQYKRVMLSAQRRAYSVLKKAPKTLRTALYLLEGKVKVYPDGSDEAVEIEAGDLVVFPKGLSCTWDVSVTVDKHYYHSE